MSGIWQMFGQSGRWLILTHQSEIVGKAVALHQARQPYFMLTNMLII